MKFAYLVFVHKNPDQFIRLIKAIDNPDSVFYIHVDKKVDLTPYKKLEEIIDPEKITWLRRKGIVWAGFNMIRVSLDGLREIIKSKQSISHVTLLSGQDYPIKPTTEFHTFLKNYGKDYIETSTMPRPNWQNGGLDRILYYHIHFAKLRLTYPLFSYLDVKLKYKQYGIWDILKKIIPYMPKSKPFPRKFLENTTPYEGSQWWTLSFNTVKSIIRFLDTDKHFYNYFKYTHVADEMFFQTMVMNNNINQAENIINNNLRYVDWNSQSGHPRTLDTTDLDKLAKNGAFFARKFDEDSEVLNLIDKNLLSNTK
jgi:hypothetical protein